MRLSLTIENMDRLQDGGPLRVEVEGRGLDIGRDQHLDWTLPDQNRFISGKHCEVRFRDGGYYLHDVSSNGTFLNGGEYRMQSPHRLRTGDRLQIGDYIVAVDIAGEVSAAEAAPAAQAAGAYADPWGGVGEAAPPVDRRDFAAAASPKRTTPDFPEWALQIDAPPSRPSPAAPRPQPAPAPRAETEDWISRAPAALPQEEPPPPPPVPRRPTRAEPEADWSSEEPQPARAPAARQEAHDAIPDEVLQRIARAAGLPETIFSDRGDRAAEEIGAVLRQVARHLVQMLAARAETKRAIRSGSRTMHSAVDNNPLKFSLSPEEALKVMFGPRHSGFLDAQAAIEQSFGDLKAHQVQTFSAMQAALEALFEDLAPDRIDATVAADRGLGAVVGSRKAKLWDAYVERWRAKAGRSDGRLVDAFTRLFAESYDRLQGKDVR